MDGDTLLENSLVRNFESFIIQKANPDGYFLDIVDIHDITNEFTDWILNCTLLDEYRPFLGIVSNAIKKSRYVFPYENDTYMIMYSEDVSLFDEDF